MMQSTFKPESQVQTSVDYKPMVYESIMARGYPFVSVKRINVNESDIDLEKEVQSRCVDDGEPIILEGFHQQSKWRSSLFTFPYLQAEFGHEKILCRDLHNTDDVSMTMAQYIEAIHGDSLNGELGTSSGSYARRYSSLSNNQDPSRRKPLIYAKDLTCPSTWRDFLMNESLPKFLAYMRENDLNNTNKKLAAENLMVYIGQEGTWTPAHIDQCGAIGHNIMTWAAKDASSIWFMIRTKDKDKAEMLWKSFGQPLDYEGYFASLDELQRATFPIYVVKQMIGDLVMVPSQCVHQVINLGAATIKVSWNRLTPNCLKAAMNSVLPRYRQIGRPEGYRIKVIITSTLKAWTEQLESQEDNIGMPKNSFCMAFKEVLALYRDIVEEDWVDMRAMGSKCDPFEPPKRLKGSQPAIYSFNAKNVLMMEMLMIFAHDAIVLVEVPTNAINILTPQRYYNMLWTSVVGDKSGWKCFRCQGICPCVQPNDKRISTGCAPLEASHTKSLWFTWPEDDPRNRGGINDNLESFELQADHLSGEDSWIERPKAAHGLLQIPKKTKPRSRIDDMPKSFKYHFEKPLAPEGLSANFNKSKRPYDGMSDDNKDVLNAYTEARTNFKRSKSNTGHTGDLSDINDFPYYRTNKTLAQSTNTKNAVVSLNVDHPQKTSEALFVTAMGEEEELVRAFAAKAGLTRTLESLNTLHLVAGMSAYDIFAMDKRCATVDPSVRASFRKDLMERKLQLNINDQTIVVPKNISAGKQHQTYLRKVMTHGNSDEERHVRIDGGVRKDSSDEKLRRRRKATEKLHEDVVGEDRGACLEENIEHINDGTKISGTTKEAKEKSKISKKDKETNEESAGEDQPQIQPKDMEEEVYEKSSNRRLHQNQLEEHQELMRKDARVRNRGKLKPVIPVKRQGAVLNHQSLQNNKFSRTKGYHPRSLSPTPAIDQKQNQDNENMSKYPLRARKNRRSPSPSTTISQQIEDEIKDSSQQQPYTPKTDLADAPSHHSISPAVDETQTEECDEEDLKQRPYQTRRVSRSKDAQHCPASSDVNISQRQDQSNEDSSTQTATLYHLKQSRRGMSPTLSKYERKQKPTESHKKDKISRRAIVSRQKKANHLNNIRDIPNHSISSNAEPSRDINTETCTRVNTNENTEEMVDSDDIAFTNDNNINKDKLPEANNLDGPLSDEELMDSNATCIITNSLGPANLATSKDTVQLSPSRSNDKVTQESRAKSEEAVAMTPECDIDSSNAAIKRVKETKFTLESSQETTLMSAETTSMSGAQKEQPAVEQISKPVNNSTIEDSANTIDASRSIKSATNGANNNKADDAINSNLSITNIAATTSKTSVPTISTLSETPVISGRTIKLVRSSASYSLAKELIDNSTKMSVDLMTTTTASVSAQNCTQPIDRVEPRTTPLSSSSSELSPSSSHLSSSIDSSVDEDNNTLTPSPTTPKSRESSISKAKGIKCVDNIDFDKTKAKENKNDIALSKIEGK
ncbi:hypothetical protein FBU30_006768, partial [Linnemannia zychae]